MAPLLCDLTGQVFGRLTVLDRAPSRSGRLTCWRCQCSCGRVTTTYAAYLKDGTTKSCGCYRVDCGRAKATHGKRWTPEYAIWLGMRRRCYTPSVKAYPFYGGRGIIVCERWSDFQCFYDDMGPRPSPKHSIERIDVDGPYAPDNCVWATLETQADNKRRSLRITYAGQTMTLKQWARTLGLPYHEIWQRLYRLSWSVERALTTPVCH